MTARRTGILALAIGLALACGGSGGTAGEGAQMEVRTGVPSLAKHIKVPEVFHDARWTARPKGTVGGVPGPTDLELLAWFPVSDAERAAVEAVLGPTIGDAEVSVPAALADALPAGLTSERQADRVVLRGTGSPAGAFENIRWKAAFAVWLPGGIAVYLHSS